VCFNTATRIGEHGPFDNLVQKLGIPNPAKSGHCTRDMKIKALEKQMQILGHKRKDFITAIGIRADEQKRVSRSRTDVIYPLVSDFPTTELGVRQFWARQAFDLQLSDYRGNCDLCFKKSERKLMTCMSEMTPQDVHWWIDQEEASVMGHRFTRSSTPLRELYTKALLGDFKPQLDKFHGRDLLS